MTQELKEKIAEIKHHLDEESKEWVYEGLEELIGIELSLHSQDLKRKVEEMQYMYEHQKPGVEGDIFCEKCREAVKVGSPCKESKYYVVWQALEDVLALIEGR